MLAIAGLLQGLPDGTEEEQLWSFEEDMERNSVLLRQYKSSNEQVSATVTSYQVSSHCKAKITELLSAVAFIQGVICVACKTLHSDLVSNVDDHSAEVQIMNKFGFVKDVERGGKT